MKNLTTVKTTTTTKKQEERKASTKFAQENAAQKNERYRIDGQNTTLSCAITKPMEIHQHCTVPGQTEDDHPVLRKDVEATVQLSKKGQSAAVDNIPAKLVQAVGEAVITALTTICSKIWQTVEWPALWTQSLVVTVPNRATCSSARTAERSDSSGM